MDLKAKVAMLEVMARREHFDCFDCAKTVLAETGIREDWHEYAYYLDELCRRAILKDVGYGYHRCHAYSWNR